MPQALESAISLRSPGSFYWAMASRSQDVGIYKHHRHHCSIWLASFCPREPFLTSAIQHHCSSSCRGRSVSPSFLGVCWSPSTRLAPVPRRFFWREGGMPGSGARVGQHWEKPLQVKGAGDKQIVGAYSEAESTALGRRGSDRALGCRCRRPETVSWEHCVPTPWGGVSPSRTAPGFSQFALLCSSCGHSPDPTPTHAP